MQALTRRLGVGAAGLLLILGAVFAWQFLRGPSSPAPLSPTPAAPPPVVDVQALERGRYLVEHVAVCFGCHSEQDTSLAGFPPLPGLKGAGDACGTRLQGTFCAPNLTPDKETGLGSWTDAEVIRALREGRGKENQALHPAMPSQAYRVLSDEDAQAIVTYLRSLPPVRKVRPRTAVQYPQGPTQNLSPLTGPVPNPDPQDELAQGRYLVTLAQCQSCHGENFAGGKELRGPQGLAVAVNITPSDTGIGAMSRDPFIGRFQVYQGMAPTQAVYGQSSPMPWHDFAGMSREDLAAVYRFLRTVPPVQNETSPFPEASAKPPR